MLGEIKKFLRDDGIIKISRNLKNISMRLVTSINETTLENSNEKIERIIVDSEEQNKLIDKIAILELIETLNVRDKEIIKLRYFKEKTQLQVAEILGISQVQVSRLERRILNELKTKFIT